MQAVQFGLHKMFFLLFFAASILLQLIRCQTIEYKEEYFDQKVDHFNFESYGDQSYKQRYFYNDTWWDKGRGPIFFYAGHEMPLEGSWKNNGFIHEIAPQHKALILFMEHRYYGKSMPFGNGSLETPKIGLLGIEQALTDYAFLLTEYQKANNAQDCPVIAFGISYGGLLSAFMRFKYPNIVQGSISSSGPVRQLAGITSGDLYYQSTTQSFRNTSAKCESRVRAGFQQLDVWSKRGNRGLRKISLQYNLCSHLKSMSEYEAFLIWIRGGYADAAANNFPYPTKFQAFPVKEMCNRLEKEKDSPVIGMRSASGVTYNSTGDKKCFDIWSWTRDPTVNAWDYQLCTEIIQEGSTNGVEDMFPVLTQTPAMRDEYCQKRWNTKVRRDWLVTEFWGDDISSSSNILFSNGNMDPWAPGGVLRNVSDTIQAIIIQDAAHHLDLRSSNPADPQSVKDARKYEVKLINKWIDEFYSARNLPNPIK